MGVGDSLKEKWTVVDKKSNTSLKKIMMYLFPFPRSMKSSKKNSSSKANGKNQARGPVPHALKPREVVQMDTIDFGALFAFTGIDIFTREADILVAPALTADYGCMFLEQSMDRRFDGHVELLQNDGGPEFKDTFKRHVYDYCDRHRVSRPYKKNEQAYIEALTEPYEKNASDGQNIVLMIFLIVPILSNSFSTAIITTGHIWEKA